VAGLAAYGAGYLAFEGLFYPDDLTTFITMLRRRVLGPPVEAA
jgi:hypothetical protein